MTTYHLCWFDQSLSGINLSEAKYDPICILHDFKFDTLHVSSSANFTTKYGVLFTNISNENITFLKLKYNCLIIELPLIELTFGTSPGNYENIPSQIVKDSNTWLLKNYNKKSI